MYTADHFWAITECCRNIAYQLLQFKACSHFPWMAWQSSFLGNQISTPVCSYSVGTTRRYVWHEYWNKRLLFFIYADISALCENFSIPTWWFFHVSMSVCVCFWVDGWVEFGLTHWMFIQSVPVGYHRDIILSMSGHGMIACPSYW